MIDLKEVGQQLAAALQKARAAVLQMQNERLCTCCLHTEHDADKTGRPWIVFNPRRRENCPRCRRACANERCGELPANPDGRGYGRLPTKARVTYFRT